MGGVNCYTQLHQNMPAAESPIEVVHFHRKPFETSFSIERVFRDVRAALPSNIRVRQVVSRFHSKGLFRRCYNILEAFLRRGQLNHVTGDVHFLTYLLPKGSTVLTVHDLGTLNSGNWLKNKVMQLLWFWLPEKRASIVTVISESTKAQLLSTVKADPRKVLVVYDPVSDIFTPHPKAFNAESPTILQVGTGSNKNLERLAQAVRGLACQVRIVGRLTEGQVRLLEECKIRYSSVCNITDLELLREYIDCDLLVFASTYEGFGLPIIEANAVGRPVVTSGISSMPEVAGKAACLVDPFDSASIRRGIERIIRDPAYRNEIVNLGFENTKRFRSQAIAAEYATIYRMLANKALQP